MHVKKKSDSSAREKDVMQVVWRIVYSTVEGGGGLVDIVGQWRGRKLKSAWKSYGSVVEYLRKCSGKLRKCSGRVTEL